MSARLSSTAPQVHARIRGALHDIEMRRQQKAPPNQLDVKTNTSQGPAPADNDPNKDLVNRLITDNKALWDQLLTNTFPALKMGTLKQGDPGYDEAVKGFKWYMIQDFMYCTRDVGYQSDRAVQTDDVFEYVSIIQKAQKYCDYAIDSLATCVNKPDADVPGLGIDPKIVFKSKPTSTLNDYTDFQHSKAEHENWSYYQIADALSKDPKVDKTAPWYKTFITANLSPKSVNDQIKFFQDYYEGWKDHYEEASDIFRQACIGEINLWGVTANPPKDI
ncbi:uncharacterized protein FIBRA_02667 [Fibroporia radiculosa]|uniref:Thiaminase-2/PQQC domain-containing protein n=1 Tax=Fibroporia radiculosa TaxID=599839 RepID=J4GN13_9APHY|nr:uncharacterized protein FIBRA_02667 [Fibroporia radiculosa]CCM00630.1 predicted protein [Fibroporia radiculosa]